MPLGKVVLFFTTRTLGYNLISLTLVSLVFLTGWFRHTIDLVFLNLLLHWGLAGLLFVHAPDVGSTPSDENETLIASSMVEKELVEKIDTQRWYSNLSFCLTLLITGLPSLIGIIFYYSL